MAGRTQKIVSTISAFFILLFLLALLNRTGSLILLWDELPLGNVTHDNGFGYYAWIPNENISKLRLPFYLKEDDQFPDAGPLSVNEDLTASIQDLGGGRYQLMENNDLYFSAVDNHPENHEYSILSPQIIRSRYLLVCLIPASMAFLCNLYISLKNKTIDNFKTIIRIVFYAFLLLLLLPWDRKTFPAVPSQIGPLLVKPILQRNVFFVGLLLVFLISDMILNKNSKLIKLLAAVIIIINTTYYFIPEWDWYGQRADSGAYLQHYSASSIRTPGYPVFIEAVYTLSGSHGLSEVRETEENAPDEMLQNGITTDSRGLLTVVRAQKCILAVSFLILFAVFRKYYPDLWYLFAAQIILPGGFLGVDNSYIMTECLSQALLLLITALLLLTLKEKSSICFLGLCIFSAAAILIRPANIFLGLPLLICLIVLIRGKCRLLIPLIGCAVFAALCAIPAVTIYRQYHIFVWMPTSGYVEIARAVDLMQPEDESAFDDPEQIDFFRSLYTRKQQYPDADQNTSMWQVAVAAAEESGYDRITCSPIFGKVSRKIFSLHFREFASSLTRSICIAMERTRLQYRFLSFPVLTAAFLLLFLLRINTDSSIGILLVLMHWGHLCLSMVNQPERRYIYSTEILCLFGWLLILMNLINSFSGRKKQVQHPVIRNLPCAVTYGNPDRQADEIRD